MTFSEGRTVRGVTVIGNELYVLRMPANNEIEVYNVDEVKLERHLSVPRLRDAVDLASCSRRLCLYVAGLLVFFDLTVYCYDHYYYYYFIIFFNALRCISPEG